MKKRNTKRTTDTKKETGTGNFPGWLFHIKLHLLVIFLLSFGIYFNALFNDYALDDAIVITDNMYTKQGIKGIPDILRYDTFKGFFKVEGKDKLVQGGRYRPFTLLMFAVEVSLFGLNPLPGHLINILLFGLTGMLLYLILLELFRTKKKKAYGYFIALVATLLFISHPVHTEAVTNIKGRDEIMTLLGSLAALYMSITGFEKKGRKHWLWVFLFFSIALFSKENAITFLAIVPLSYYFFKKTSIKTALIQTLPFFIAAVIFLIVRGNILGWSLGAPSRALMNNPFLKLVDGHYIDFTFGEKMATIMFTLGKYIQLLLFPHPLVHDYYPRHIQMMSFGDWRVILSLLIYAGLIVYSLMGWKKRDPVAYGILFYLITLSIVSNIIFPVGTNMSERFIFMPSIGFVIVIAVLLYRFAEYLNKKNNINSFIPLKIPLAFTGMIVILFSIKTITRNTVWKDNLTLFTTDVKTAPNSAKLLNAAGGELIAQSLKQSDPAKKTKMLEEAVGYLQKAVKIHPAFKNAYLLLGNANNYLKNYEKSIEYYRYALKLYPAYREAKNNLTQTYQDAGKYYGEQKHDINKALKYLNLSYKEDPGNAETQRLLGVAYGVARNYKKSIEFFTKALAQYPDDADLIYDLGSAFYNSGNIEKGNELHQKALKIKPDLIEQRKGK